MVNAGRAGGARLSKTGHNVTLCERRQVITLTYGSEGREFESLRARLKSLRFAGAFLVLGQSYCSSGLLGWVICSGFCSGSLHVGEVSIASMALSATVTRMWL